MQKIVIGVDPSFRKKGMAICSIEGSDVYFKTFETYLEFLGWVINGDAPIDAVFCIENSNLQNTTFNMSGGKAQVAKVSRNVGKNQAVSQITVDLLVVKYGKDRVIDISPRQKGRKLTKEQFVAASGIKKRTNQDERDAWQLAQIGIQRTRNRIFKAA